MKRSNDQISSSATHATHVILNMSSVYDNDMGFFIYADISVLGDIDISKIYGSCPSHREDLNFKIYDNNGEHLPEWKDLDGAKELIEFQLKHHCVVIPCKYDE
jgi:hypothetical protein